MLDNDHFKKLQRVAKIVRELSYSAQKATAGELIVTPHRTQP